MLPAASDEQSGPLPGSNPKMPLGGLEENTIRNAENAKNTDAYRGLFFF
jgi:hypothetical protein